MAYGILKKIHQILKWLWYPYVWKLLSKHLHVSFHGSTKLYFINDPTSGATSGLTLITPSAFAFEVVGSSWNTFWVFSTWFIVTHIFSFTFVFDWIHYKIGFTFTLIWTHCICANSICTARFTSLAFIYIIAVKTVTLFGFQYFAHTLVQFRKTRILTGPSEKNWRADWLEQKGI